MSDQGVFSFFRGNTANLYRLFIHSFSNILIFQQINKDLGKFSSAFISSTIGLILSYPFDLARTRMSGDMTRWGNKKIYTSMPDLFNKVMHEDSKNYLIRFYKDRFLKTSQRTLDRSIIELYLLEYEFQPIRASK